jgi:ADP-ribosylglycohydrolase
LDIEQNTEKIYAGVLGKLIGVYFGRPVEGWFYDDIRSRFEQIYYYVHDEVGMPIIIPDDDISGTFVFFRALEDNAYSETLDAKAVGKTWLNYIVENKTILWWGGLNRSSEHTAYIRLKQGYEAPESGSVALNGSAMAEQIGAQIFIDAWALANPSDPERAVALAREAASVSHDGISVEAASLIAAIEAMAFDEGNVETLLDKGLAYVEDARLLSLIDDVRNHCARETDWRAVRDWISRNHDYDRYPGNCPMPTNHAAVIMALLMGGDDFQESISIAASAGWDTDCNAGNVGCINGVRLGLQGIDAGPDFRTPVADRMYFVNADGGSCVTDAVQESRKIITAAGHLHSQPVTVSDKRFDFEFPGSLQGFSVEAAGGVKPPVCYLRNANTHGKKNGLEVVYSQLARGLACCFSTPVFKDPAPKAQEGTSNFEVFASPTLYPSQVIDSRIICEHKEAPFIRYYIDYYGKDGTVTRTYGRYIELKQGENPVSWTVPDTEGLPIYRLGIELSANRRMDGSIIVDYIDWKGAPSDFHMDRAMELSPSLTPWTIDTFWLNAFVSSIDNFYPDYTTTFSLSHVDANGVATIGTREWDDYSVSSTLTLNKQRTAGVVIRARGHRRYYAGVLRDGKAMLLKRKDDEETKLAEMDFPHETVSVHSFFLNAAGDEISLHIDGKELVRASEGEYTSGAAGFLIEEGAVLADGFQVRGVPYHRKNDGR